MKKKRLITRSATIAIALVVLITACKKDDFVEIFGECPIVVSTNPADAATGVQLDQIITVTFNEAMNPATITPTSFTLQGQGATLIAGTVSYTGSTASFTPSSALVPFTSYTGKVSTSVKDLTGNALQTDYMWTFRTQDTLPPVVDLKSGALFGILAGTGINNTGLSEINDMDIGVSPGLRSSITGFPPGIVVNGTIYAADDIIPPGTIALLLKAKQDLMDAYLFAAAATSPVPDTVASDLGGTTLTPGIYKSTAVLFIQSGDLTLDAQGDADAVWIFQAAAGLNTSGGPGGSVILEGGAQAKNVFWQTNGSVTIGASTSFKGIVLALSSITMNAGATAEGRMLALNGIVVLAGTNIINKP